MEQRQGAIGCRRRDTKVACDRGSAGIRHYDFHINRDGSIGGDGVPDRNRDAKRGRRESGADSYACAANAYPGAVTNTSTYSGSARESASNADPNPDSDPGSSVESGLRRRQRSGAIQRYTDTVHLERYLVEFAWDHSCEMGELHGRIRRCNGNFSVDSRYSFAGRR